MRWDLKEKQPMRGELVKRVGAQRGKHSRDKEQNVGLRWDRKGDGTTKGLNQGQQFLPIFFRSL